MKLKLANVITLAIASFFMLIILAPNVGAANIGQVCDPLSSGKIDVSGSIKTITVTAPSGKLISGYCVKAGSINQGLGPEYYRTIPVKTVTISHSSGKDISHYSVRYVDEVTSTTVSTSSTSTTSSTTSTTVSTTTSIPVISTTLNSTTTSIIENTSVPDPTSSSNTTIVTKLDLNKINEITLAETGSRNTLFLFISGCAIVFVGAIIILISNHKN